MNFEEALKTDFITAYLLFPERFEQEMRTRAVMRQKVGNLEISTVNTPDCGLETAITDKSGLVFPVQRYEGFAQAVEGHASWVSRAPELKEVDMLLRSGGVLRHIKLQV